MNLEILMFLLYLLGALCCGVSAVMLARMGVHRTVRRGIRMLGRRLRRTRRNGLRAVPAVLIAAGIFCTGGADCHASAERGSASDPRGQVLLEMDGTPDGRTGTRYVRADNCGIRCDFAAGEDAYLTLRIDGDEVPLRTAHIAVLRPEEDAAETEPCSGAEAFPEAREEPETGWAEGTVTVDPAELAVRLPDGPHTVSASLAAGEEELARAEIPFVLDTKAPRVRVSVLTKAAKPEPDAADGRCYFNADFTIRAEVEEENPAVGRITLRRDFASADQRDFSRAAVNTLGPDQFGEGGVLTDTVDADGVYQYTLSGSDMAGNPLVFEPGPYLYENGTSRLMVRDTEAPAGRITVTDGRKELFSMNEKGYSRGTAQYPAESRMEASVTADEGETLPVRIRGTLFSPDGSRTLTETGEGQSRPDGYRYGASLLFEPDRNASFFIQDLVMEDLAGNRTVFPRTPLIRPRFSAAGRSRSDGAQAEPDAGRAVGADSGGKERKESGVSASTGERTKHSLSGAPDAEPEGEQNPDTPSVSVRYDNNDVRNDRYFCRPRTALIRVRKETFHPDRIHISAGGGEVDSQWEEDGAYRIKRVRFAEDGKCSLSVSVTDALGNPYPPQEISGAAADRFVIDTKKPVMSVQGVRDGSANAETPKISVILRDEWADGCTVSFRLQEGERDEKEVKGREEGKAEELSVSGNTDVSGEEEGNTAADAEARQTGCRRFRLSVPKRDAFYRLTCQAADPAGNRTVTSVSFSVNRTGTVFEVRPFRLNGAVRNRPVVPEVHLHDLDDVSVLSASVNGRETKVTRRGQTVRFDHLPSADGSYELGLVTRDSSGHVSRMKPVRFRLDRTPPVLAVVLPGESRTYIGSVDILLVTDDREDRIESVRIDGRSLPETEIRREGEARKVTVNTYGTHRLTASAADAAGNRSGEVSCTVRVVRHTFESLFGRYGWRLILMGGVALAAGAAVLRRKAEKRAGNAASETGGEEGQT